MTEIDDLPARLLDLPGVARLYPAKPTLGERLTRAATSEVVVRQVDGVAVVSADLGVSADGSAIDAGLAAAVLAREAVAAPHRARIRIVAVE